jgi:hypothetical protein
MTTESTLTYKALAGKQVPEQFEGGVPDTLKLDTLAGAEVHSEQVGLTAKLKSLGEEPLEIKAKA